MKDLAQITPDKIKAYQDEISLSSSPATVKRKTASLNKFFDWAANEGHIPVNPITPTPVTPIPVLIPDEKPIITTKSKTKVGFKAWAILTGTIGMAVITFFGVLRLGVPIPFITNRAATGSTPNPIAVNRLNIPTMSPNPSTVPSPTPIATPTFPADTAVNINYNDNNESLSTPTPITNSGIGGLSDLVLIGTSPSITGNDGDLLIEGKTLTLKTKDGSDGDITLNPDGSGNLNVIFEGSSSNLLDLQASNLSSGSLYYGNVGNNSTGYNLLRLQSGSSPVTRFNVDATGNVYASGNINTPGNVQINGVTRLSSLGRLTSITGYYQDSGLFEIDQGAPDFAKITKTLSSSEGVSTADLLNLTLDESSLGSGSNTNTLVLNRLGGGSDALALLIDSGNARFDGVVRLGQFSSAPTAIGGGSLYFNTTDSTPYYHNGTSWSSLVGSGSGTNYWDIASGALFPTSSTLDVLFGGSATSSAKFAFKNVASGTPTASISGTTTNVATFIDGNGNISTTNRANLVLGNSSTYDSTGLILLNPNGTGSVGIGTTGPDSKLDILDASNPQLRLTHTDGSAYTTFQTASTGDLTITPSGGDLNLAGNLTLTGTNLLTTGARASGNSYTIYVSGGTYFAVSNYGGTNYSNTTLATLVESVVADLNTLGGGSVRFQHGTFDFGTGNFTCNAQHDIEFAGQGIDATFITNSSDAAADTEPLSFTNCKRWTIRDMTVSAGGTARSSSDAIDADQGDEFLIERVKITDSRSRGIVFDGKDLTGTGTADRNIIRDNIITGSSIDGDGIELLASSRNLISGNKIYDIGGHGIQVNKSSASASQPNKQSQYNSVIGNDIYNVGQDGININASSNNIVSNNNVLNSANVTASRDGVRIQTSDAQACSFNVINGNTLTDDQGTATQRYGVNVSDTECSFNTIANNYIESNLTADINDSGTQTQYSQYRAGTNYIAKTIVTDTDGTTDYLGIGDTTPTSRLDITDAITTTGTIINATASAITSGNMIKLGHAGATNFTGNGVYMDFDNTGGGSFTGNYLKFDNAASTVYTVDASGNVATSGYYTAQANQNLEFRATGTGLGNSGTGSIYFQDSTGGTKARLDTTKSGLDTGDGSDGAVTFSADTTVNDDSQTYFGIEAVSSTATSGQATVPVASTTNLAAGDEVLIIQMQGEGAGSYEFRDISSVSSNASVTFTESLVHSYTEDSTSSAQIVEVPQFTNVTVSSAANISPPAWDGNIGGILVFRATGSVICNTTDFCMQADGDGFRGGASSEAGAAQQGEGVGTQANSTSRNFNAGGGGGRATTGGGGAGGGNFKGGTVGTTAGSGTGGGAGRAIAPLNLGRMYLGAGGGAGGDDSDVAGVDGGAGGDGAGIIFVEADQFIVVGTANDGIRAIGEDGNTDSAAANDGGGGGGGGAGVVWLRASRIDFQDSLELDFIDVNAGSGGAASGTGGAGGGGGDGQAIIQAKNVTGTPNGGGASIPDLLQPRDNIGNSYGTLHVGKVDAEAADVAEIYQSEQNLEPGDIVEPAFFVTDPKINPTLAVQKTNNESNALMGVVSTAPGLVLGSTDIPDNYKSFPIALTGRTPVKILGDKKIKKGDAITTSHIPGIGSKATTSEYVVGYALEEFDPDTSAVFPCGIDLECGRVMTFIQPGWAEIETNIAKETIEGLKEVTQDVASDSARLIADTSTFADYVTENIAKGARVTGNEVITGLLTARNIVSETIKTGVLVTENLATTTFNATSGAIDKLIVKTGLASPTIATNLISPLEDSPNLAVRIGSEATPEGKLAIQNTDGAEVASIDSLGNATFSGTVTSDSTVTKNLVAENIESKSLDEIKTLLAEVETNQDLLKESAKWNIETATAGAQFNSLAVNDFYVTGQAAVNSLYLAKAMTVGQDLSISSASNGTSIINSIDTITAPLRLQAMAAAPIELMAGLITIDTDGNMNITGNLYVAGQIQSQSLALKPKEGEVGDILSIKDATDNVTSSIDASGSAKFTNVSTQNLIIAGNTTSPEASEVDGVITTNSSVGKAKIPSGIAEITIKNPKVTDNTLVYVTPTSDTENRVLFIKKKEAGQFTVGFSNPIGRDAEFNWWIVLTQNQ